MRIPLTAFHHVSDFLRFNIGSGNRGNRERRVFEGASLVRLDLRHLLASELTGRLEVKN